MTQNGVGIFGAMRDWLPLCRLRDALLKQLLQRNCAMAQPLGKMIVMAAFDKADQGNLVPASDPREFNAAAGAKREDQIEASRSDWLAAVG
jgi:hypothetical protein